MKDSYTFWPATESIVRFLLSVGPIGRTYQEQRRNEMSNPLRWWNFWVLNDEKYGYPSRNPRWANKLTRYTWPRPAPCRLHMKWYPTNALPWRNGL